MEPSRRNVIEVFLANGFTKREWLTYKFDGSKFIINSTKNPNLVNSFFFRKIKTESDQPFFAIHLMNDNHIVSEMALSVDPEKNILIVSPFTSNKNQKILTSPIKNDNNKIIYRLKSIGRCVVKTPKLILAGRTSGHGSNVTLNSLCDASQLKTGEKNFFAIYSFRSFAERHGIKIVDDDDVVDEEDENIENSLDNEAIKSKPEAKDSIEDSVEDGNYSRRRILKRENRQLFNNRSNSNGPEKIDNEDSNDDDTTIRFNPDESIDICTSIKNLTNLTYKK